MTMQLKFTVTGMTCAACSSRVEKVTAAVPGVEKAEVNLLAGSMVVYTQDPEVVAPIQAAVEKAGYKAFVAGEKKEKQKAEPSSKDELKEMKIRIIGSGICLVILM